MQPITIILDGREVSGHAGTTILELARESGVKIPTLCHEPHLAPYGACRICLVEDERSAVLLASCVTPIASGMVINTASPRVLERRKNIVKLMLASHPDSCLVCDKGNHCELRKIAADMGIGLVDFQRIPQTAVMEDVNPFIQRDLSKCILCAKCIRADQELVVEGALDYIHRGFGCKPATLNNLPLEKSECTFCGTCVALCPTGALMEKETAYRGTAATTVSTTCPFCGGGCNISLEVKDNRIVRARPGKDGANRSTLCVRGSYGLDFVHSPERLTSPLVRANGDWKKASWEEALEVVAAALKQTKQAYGPSSLAVLGSSKGTNEENYLLQRLARGVLGTNNIDNGSRLYNSASRVGLGHTLGSRGTTGSLDNLESSEVILVIGANPSSSAPVVGYAIKRAVKYGGARLLLADPRQTKLSSFAHLWLRPKLGTDVALLNGLASVIVTEGLLDNEFVSRSTDNFETLRQNLLTYTPERVEEITGVPSQDVRRAARLFATVSQASIVYGTGITQQATGTDAVIALANLAMLTGNIGPRGGGIYALRRDSNGQGACDMGALPDFLPGYQSLEDAPARQKFEERWGVPIPADAGLTALEMIEQAREGKIKAMYIVGENPALSFPRPASVREVLASLDFLVVQDMFLTETAKLAKVVLPAASFAEKEGTFTNFEGRVQRVRQAIKPAGESLPDGEIILRLADKLGSPMRYRSIYEVTEEIEDLVPSYRDESSVDFEMKGQPSEDWIGSTSGARSLSKGHFLRRFSRFQPVSYTPQEEIATDEYPLILLAGTTLHQFGSGSRSSRSSRLNKFQPEAYLEISEPDAGRLGISPGDKVKITSAAGQVTAKASITETLPEGTVFLPVAFRTSPATELFEVVLDPRSKTPSLKACAVKIERISADG